jgi:hypothetical protein
MAASVGRRRCVVAVAGAWLAVVAFAAMLTAMKTVLARLRLPPRWEGEPPWIEERYPDRTFDFDMEERAACQEKHRDLFIAMGADKRRFRCLCREDRSLEVMVRLREPLPYLAVMPHTSLDHDGECPFHRAPITSYVKEAVEEEDGMLRVRLNFRVGEPASEVQTSAPAENESVRRVQRQLNRFGLEGLLRLLFREAGLHRWRPWYRPEDRVTVADGWRPTYHRFLRVLEHLDAQGQRTGTLKRHTRIGEPGAVALFEKGTVLALVDVIEKVEPPKKGINWKCYLAGWGENFLIISPAQVEALVARLRFDPDHIETILTKKEVANARPGEVWWGCLLVRVEKSENGKWYRVLDQGVLKTDRRGVPGESLDEIKMTQHLIDERRAFCKPLFAGELEAAPRRRPDFILEDTAEPCCIEVAGMDGVYDYDDRDNERLDDYEKAGVPCRRWKPGEAWPVLDGPFQSVDKIALYRTTPHPTLAVVKTGRVND